MIIKQDPESWRLGYSDGFAGHKKNENQTADGLAYSSGWIEGAAAATRRTCQTCKLWTTDENDNPTCDRTGLFALDVDWCDYWQKK